MNLTNEEIKALEIIFETYPVNEFYNFANENCPFRSLVNKVLATYIELNDIELNGIDK